MEARLDPPELPDTASATSIEDYATDQTPYRVVLYSLDEAATRRAVEILKSIQPHWVIDTNADLSCTDRIKTLAQKANVFVFAWRCSKHAAYYCVKASTQKKNLVMARGVGTTSLVTAAIEFLNDRSA
jgi:S-adenosylhomocysteine hydrolase